MKRLGLLLAAMIATMPALLEAQNWPQFRGTMAGVAIDHPDLPDSWSTTENVAWITAIPGCHHVHISPTDEDMEGSFGPDILIGNGRANAMLGQPGKDIFIGNGGDDVIDARDGVADVSIQCGRGHPRVPGKPKTKSHPAVPAIPATGRPEGRALMDPQDPTPINCAATKYGTPVPGLNG